MKQSNSFIVNKLAFYKGVRGLLKIMQQKSLSSTAKKDELILNEMETVIMVW